MKNTKLPSGHKLCAFPTIKAWFIEEISDLYMGYCSETFRVSICFVTMDQGHMPEVP